MPVTSLDRLVFTLNDSVQASFPVSLSDTTWVVYNGVEAIPLDRLTNSTYKTPVFNGTLTLEDGRSGYWTDSLRPKTKSGSYRVPFELRTSSTSPPNISIAGHWDVWFGGQNNDQDGAASAQLDLRDSGTTIEGTMRTTTGDYRYLSGSFDGTSLALQTFDGAHLFYFDATYSEGQWTNGSFYSGNHYRTSWSGAPATPWESSVRFERITPPVDSLIVRFIDPEGKPSQRSLIPEPNHITVVDVLGTWCPNCMDEVRLLTSLDMENVNQLSVAFERPDSVALAYARLKTFQAEMGMDWDVVLGGKANKKVAAAAFPFLDRVISFPTTLFIQHDGTVHIHSGFNGPATGAPYKEERAAFQRHTTPSTSLENR
ncbi:MAG: hypothetical protein CMD33_07490 [Flavobacteriales bacterium]|nr:hypothetical protein [Flavobacteriales bacterium]